MINFEEEFLKVALHPYEGRHADNQLADNHLGLDSAVLEQHPELKDNVVTAMADLAEVFRPEWVSGVPNGATDLAGWVALELSQRCDREVRQVRLVKTPTGLITFEAPIDQQIVEESDNGVLTEDVINRRTTTRHALPLFQRKVMAILAAFDRGVPGEFEPLTDPPVIALAQRPIPATLPADSPLRSYLS